ncbi:hypothetical protein VW23_020715 [Devosia insulae DS-56]|uniref:Uncharacterized protein n=1 Tax=Devosia insulae DS-56 TaxID=1116389 RepID=A0A1E5XPQ4_9HYPH|nr:hypothetical protein [Devosia insulae]OEO30573.1 hypothetical protein VW23_020715 [Devosia insulae DS-56]
MEEAKRTLTVRVQSHEDFRDELMHAARAVDSGEGYQGEVHSFTSLPLFFRVFSQKRWELILKLQEIGPSSLRGLARALSRDVKRVHEDAELLLEEKVIERDKAGKLFVPFETIRIEASLPTASKSAA